MSNNPALDQALQLLERVNDLEGYATIRENLIKYGNEISVEGLKTIGVQLFMIWKNRDDDTKVNNCLEVITTAINDRGRDIPGAVDERGRPLVERKSDELDWPEDLEDLEDLDDEDDEEDDEEDEEEDDSWGEVDDDWDEEDEGGEVLEKLSQITKEWEKPSRPQFKEKPIVISSGKMETKRQPIVSVNGWIFQK